MRHENHCFTTSSDSTGRGLVKLTKSYGSWTSIDILSLSNGMQFTNCTTRKPLFHDPYESYESYGSWTSIYTQSPQMICSSQTVRLVSHCFTTCTTRTSCTGRGLVYTPQVPLMICSSQTVRLVSHCFTTRTSRTSRTSRTGRALVYTPQVLSLIHI